jgi:hypothetical protein
LTPETEKDIVHMNYKTDQAFTSISTFNSIYYEVDMFSQDFAAFSITETVSSQPASETQDNYDPDAEILTPEEDLDALDDEVTEEVQINELDVIK